MVIMIYEYDLLEVVEFEQELILVEIDFLLFENIS
jgi:hypothetical protein